MGYYSGTNAVLHYGGSTGPEGAVFGETRIVEVCVATSDYDAPQTRWFERDVFPPPENVEVHKSRAERRKDARERRREARRKR